MGMPAKKNAHYGSGMMRKPPGVSANDLWKREVSRRKSAMRKRQAEKKHAAATQDVLTRKALLAVSGGAMGAVFSQGEKYELPFEIGGTKVHTGLVAGVVGTLAEAFAGDAIDNAVPGGTKILGAISDAGLVLASAHYGAELATPAAPAPADDA